MTGLVLAATLAFDVPSPPPPLTAAYYDRLHLLAAVGDRHAELRSAIRTALGERVVVIGSDELERIRKALAEPPDMP